MNIERILNRITSQFDEAMMMQTMEALAAQVDAADPKSYRVCFPTVVESRHVYICIALIAHVDNPSLQLILSKNNIRLKAANATHVFFFQGYDDERVWRREAMGITRLFPEQPEAEEFALV